MGVGGEVGGALEGGGSFGWGVGGKKDRRGWRRKEERSEGGGGDDVWWGEEMKREGGSSRRKKGFVGWGGLSCGRSFSFSVSFWVKKKTWGGGSWRSG